MPLQKQQQKKIMVSMTSEMVNALDDERRARKLQTIPEAVRSILGEYFKARITAE